MTCNLLQQKQYLLPPYAPDHGVAPLHRHEQNVGGAMQRPVRGLEGAAVTTRAPVAADDADYTACWALSGAVC